MSNAKIRRDNNFTEFSAEYKDGEALKRIALRIRRIFHPMRGEETQVEIEAGRTIHIKGRAEHAKRYDAKSGSLNLTPVLAEQMACALQGKVWAPPAAAAPKTSGGLMVELNAYTPKDYDTMSERERQIARAAFQAGYDYRDSLEPGK